MLHFHHIFPTSAGGKDTFDNIQCLCVECHMKAHMELATKGIGCSYSWKILRAALNKTGGRTRKWLKEQRRL